VSEKSVRFWSREDFHRRSCWQFVINVEGVSREEYEIGCCTGELIDTFRLTGCCTGELIDTFRLTAGEEEYKV